MANEVITLENLGTFKEENDKLYAKKSGNYPDMNVGNILPSVNKVWENTFLFGTTAGSADTTDGKATIQSIHGKTEWNGNTPSYVNITSLKSVLFNLYDKTNEIAKVVASNSSNKGLCISGTGYDAEHLPVVNFGTDGTTFPTSITVTEKISTIGESYLGFEVPSDGYIRVENSPSDVCVSNVWSGYRVLEKAAYQVSQVTINTSSKFSTGMKSCCNGAVYDELTANRYYARISSKLCGASESLTLFATAGNYKIYRMSLSSALSLGYVELGNSTKFALSLTDLTSSSSLTADTMCLNNGYIKFAITTEEDTDYTYTKDDVIVDAETFASEKEVHGTIYVNIDGSYSEIAEYDSSITDYYYRTETSKAGQTIKDHLNGKTIVYQIKSMNKTTFTGTAISPALNLTYDISDMGTEELILVSGYTATPTLEIAYPMNIRDTVQRYQEHTISVQSFDNLAAKIKDVAGLDIQKQWNAQKNEYDFNVIDTKETILNLTSKSYNIAVGTSIELSPEDMTKLKKHNIGEPIKVLIRTIHSNCAGILYPVKVYQNTFDINPLNWCWGILYMHNYFNGLGIFACRITSTSISILYKIFQN